MRNRIVPSINEINRGTTGEEEGLRESRGSSGLKRNSLLLALGDSLDLRNFGEFIEELLFDPGG